MEVSLICSDEKYADFEHFIWTIFSKKTIAHWVEVPWELSMYSLHKN